MAFRLSKLIRLIQKNRSLQCGRSFATAKESIQSGKASTGGSTINVPSKDVVTSLPPLTEPISKMPEVVYAKSRSAEDNVTQVTTLSNGLKVASEKRYGQFCTVGVVVDSGPRYEVAYPSGISHFLEKLAFNSTENFPNKDAILKELEKHGGICDCQSSRDTFIYAASIDSRGLDTVVRLLGDVMLRPRIDEEEINFARQAVDFDLQTLEIRPEQDLILMDMIHSAAYRENTLGLPKICPKQNLEVVNRNVLLNYLTNHHTPDRMVVAGVGVDHDELCKEVEKYFVAINPSWLNTQSKGVESVDKSIAQYTGGLRKEQCDIPSFAVAELPELAHVVIGLESCSHQDPDFIAVCVLNIMMGGGGSFSAGGPGKGMYTRLYTNVLNRYHWMFSATALNHAYADTGLFCIHASAPPNNVREMIDVITRELVHMATKPDQQELRRAKTQLQSMLLMNLEARPVVFEDIGRQVLATGNRRRPENFIKDIENIQTEDIIRIAQRMLKSPPAVAARGDIQLLPDIKDVQLALANDGRLPGSKRGFFR